MTIKNQKHLINNHVGFHFTFVAVKLKVPILFIFLALVLYTFNRFVIVAVFLIEQDAIAATSCVNKDKPMMKCCGKCQLKNKLSREDKQDQQLQAKGTKEEYIVQKILNKYSRTYYIQLKGVKNPVTNCNLSSPPLQGIFHPPQA